MLKSDKQDHKKQYYTAKKILEILQSEGFTGGYTIVKDAIREIKSTSKEVLPLSQRPGEAQVDFGQAVVNFNGTLKKNMFFVMSMVHSDAMFVMAFQAAKFGLLKTIDSFDFTSQKSINEPLIRELLRCEFIDNGASYRLEQSRKRLARQQHKAGKN